MKQKPAIAAAICLILGSAAGFFFGYDIGYERAVEKSRSINSFEDCVKAGYPIQESYPEVCRTPDGKSFVNPSQSAQPQ